MTVDMIERAAASIAGLRAELFAVTKERDELALDLARANTELDELRSARSQSANPESPICSWCQQREARPHKHNCEACQAPNESNP